jgi:hypothetical protein
MTALLAALVLALVAVALAADSCPQWPDLGNRFMLRRGFVQVWRKHLYILTGSDVDMPDNDKARFRMSKQCPAARNDLDFQTTDDEPVTFASSDVKLTFCGALIRVYDCNDVEGGQLLWTITTDSCLTVANYDVHRGDEKGEVVYRIVRDSIFSRFHNLTVVPTKVAPELVYATAEQGFFSFKRNEHTFTVNATAAAQMTEQQRVEASGLFALLIATRVLNDDEDGDACTAFTWYGIPLLVLFSICALVVVVSICLKRRRRM